MASGGYDRPTILERAPAAGGGELVLRRRRSAGHGEDAYELIVDGVFAMDTVDVTTEQRLATEALAQVGGDALTVVVAGLGLGFTLRVVLDDPHVARVVVVEIEAALVDWLRAGVLPPAAGLLDDPRVEVAVADVIAWLRGAGERVADLILLDVDNGPDFLVHPANAELYQPDSLQSALHALRPEGLLAVWSADRSADLLDRLDVLARDVHEIVLPVTREGRSFDYALYLARP